MPANMPNFNFQARLVSEIWGGGGPKLKSGSSWFPYRRCLADKFLYRALVRVNAYKCAKFQLPLVTEIWRGSQNKNGRCWSPQTPHSGQIFVCSHSTCKCLSQRTKFQLSSPISFGDMRCNFRPWHELFRPPPYCRYKYVHVLSPPEAKEMQILVTKCLLVNLTYVGIRQTLTLTTIIQV